jgi:hypothetical protein
VALSLATDGSVPLQETGECADSAVLSKRFMQVLRVAGCRAVKLERGTLRRNIRVEQDNEAATSSRRCVATARRRAAGRPVGRIE